MVLLSHNKEHFHKTQEVSEMKALRYSRQRERIYEYMLATKEHPSAEMIYTDLRSEMPELSLGTVYRNLKLLEELGKVRRVTSLNGNERYDAICGDHVHFICRECGAISDLETADVQSIFRSVPLEAGFEATQLDLLITGRCAKCSKHVSN